MNNKQTLLRRAENQFLKKNYASALKLYSLLLHGDPKLKEAKVGVYLSDMGMDYDEDAQALFDYYQAIKLSSNEPDKIISDLMHVISATKLVIGSVYGEQTGDEIYDNGISYADFVDLVEKNGNLREVFEDIMFSTKVIITTKNDFIDFLERLIGAGYYEMVLGYLDTVAGNPLYDQDIYELYKLIPKEY